MMMTKMLDADNDDAEETRMLARRTNAVELSSASKPSHEDTSLRIEIPVEDIEAVVRTRHFGLKELDKLKNLKRGFVVLIEVDEVD